MTASSGQHVIARVDAERLSSVIFDYAARIGSETDPDRLLRLNADMARDLVQADRCTIWLRDLGKGELWTKVAHGLPGIHIKERLGLVGACVASNETIVVNNTAEDPRFNGRIDLSSGYVTHSTLVIPLRSPGGDVVGALQVLNKPGGFLDSDVKLLGLAASYSASAIVAQRLRQEAEAARLMYHELEIARDVQRHLFPRQPPAATGLDIAAYCRPAKLVGGDYYDCLRQSDTDFAFTLGDVSGKGISAAVLMASLQASLRTQLTRPTGPLSQIVSDFNKIVCSLDQERYSTLFCATFNARERELTYVNAGHVQPRLLRSAGVLTHLDCGGCPVGMFETAEYEQAVVKLAPGDVIACFSDGITEAANENQEIWKETEIDKLLRDGRHTTAQELLDALVGAADAYTGAAEQADDMTLVVVRVL